MSVDLLVLDIGLCSVWVDELKDNIDGFFFLLLDLVDWREDNDLLVLGLAHLGEL